MSLDRLQEAHDLLGMVQEKMSRASTFTDTLISELFEFDPSGAQGLERARKLIAEAIQDKDHQEVMTNDAEYSGPALQKFEEVVAAGKRVDIPVPPQEKEAADRIKALEKALEDAWDRADQQMLKSRKLRTALRIIVEDQTDIGAEELGES